LNDSVEGAKAAVTTALEKETKLLAAGEQYKSDTGSLYTEMIAATASAQAAYEATADTAGIIAGSLSLDPLKVAAGGTAATVVGIAGAVNTTVQTLAAIAIRSREQKIDYAGIDFAVTTESVDAALMVNQARQQLSTLKREQVANNLAASADAAARSQAVAQRDTLIAELVRIVIKRNANVAAIRKKSYADPLHYDRAEHALIDADESFRTAQRWS